MGAEDVRGKGREFWKKVEKVAESGRVPYIKIQTAPIPKKDLPFGRKRLVQPDPNRRYSHFRTRSQGGRGKPLCIARGCYNRLAIGDLLCCSQECLDYLKGSCERILEIIAQQPEFVYTDFLKGMGRVKVSGKVYTEADDELKGLDGNRYRGFVRRDNEGPGVGIVSREEIPDTHRLSNRNFGTRFPDWLWTSRLPRVAPAPPRVRPGASHPEKARP